MPFVLLFTTLVPNLHGSGEFPYRQVNRHETRAAAAEERQKTFVHAKMIAGEKIKIGKSGIAEGLLKRLLEIGVVIDGHGNMKLNSPKAVAGDILKKVLAPKYTGELLHDAIGHNYENLLRCFIDSDFTMSSRFNGYVPEIKLGEAAIGIRPAYDFGKIKANSSATIIYKKLAVNLRDLSDPAELDFNYNLSIKGFNAVVSGGLYEMPNSGRKYMSFRFSVTGHS